MREGVGSARGKEHTGYTREVVSSNEHCSTRRPLLTRLAAVSSKRHTVALLVRGKGGRREKRGNIVEVSSLVVMDKYHSPLTWPLRPFAVTPASP